MLGCLLVNEGRIEALTPIRMLNDIRALASRAFQVNTARQSRRNAAHHYDIGNDLYEAFLDDEMVYSCSFFTPEAKSLDAERVQDLALAPTTAKPSRSPPIVSLGASGRPQ